MPRVLDFNNLQNSILDITLRDEARTVVHLDIPSEEVINELQNMGPEIERMKTGNQAAVNGIYDLAARLINCNLDYFTTTGDELMRRYGMNLVLTLQFFSAYMDCIAELSNQKN
jgi:hypothetical protein